MSFMNEKDMMLLIALPFLSILVVTLVNLANNPWGTIHGIYKFQLSIYDKIFTNSNQKADNNVDL